MTTTFLIQGGDVSVSAATGQVRMVADGPKLEQDVKEMLATAERAGGIGAGLDRVVDGSPADLSTLQAEIARKIRAAIRRMQGLQLTFHKNERPPEELVAALLLLRVTRLENFDTAFAFRVEVSSVRGAVATTSGVLA